MVDARDVCELEAERVAVRIPRDRIRRISARRGFTAERPVAQFLAGMIGAIGGSIFFASLQSVHSRGEGTIVIAAAMFFLFGTVMALTALRRGVYLYVETSTDTRKLVLRGSVTREGLADFLAAVRRDFGLEVDSVFTGD